MIIAPAVLLDLDGTLTEPYEGISRSVVHALAQFGVPAPDEATLRSYIGPPMIESFRAVFGGDEAKAEAALGHYRHRFGERGLFENAVFDGIPEAISDLRREGVRIVLATSKPRFYAVQILEHFGLMPLFDAAHGSELDGRNNHKTDLIAHIIDAERVDPARAVMVGDRRHDVIGARANGVRCIAVEWGYGTDAEFAECLPDRRIGSVGDLAPAVLEMLRGAGGPA